MQRRTKWWLAGALVGIPAVGVLTLLYLAKQHAAKIEPYIRDQAVAYLRDRFRAEVEIADLRIHIPALSPVKLYVSKGRGVLASVTGRGILLKKNENMLLKLQTMRFEVDLGLLFEPHKGVTAVYLDGVEIVVPPKGERPKSGGGEKGGGGESPDVRIGEIVITNAKLTISPKDKSRKPLEFDLHRIRLMDAGIKAPMRYEAELRNAKPPGEINATGKFGPWEPDEPGDTPLDGDYKFERANLAVFNAIGGILNSTGHFQGKLNDIVAKGEATVPDFYLKSVGNKMPLQTTFEVQVDGTNGNTILKPVHGRLGTTSFVTSGGVVKHDGDQRRTIALDVNMPAGRLEDMLLLAMKGKDPFMSGLLQMKSKILLPPLSGKVIEKLRLNGQFVIKDAKFLRSQMQDRIDKMSRQAQGQPKNEGIDEVVSGMSGRFTLANESITLQDLSFGIPGADLKLNGTYNLDNEEIDFHGDLRLQAKLSQTQTGWKRWALKPVDPFFAKEGAGLYTKIQVTGTRKEPKFGRAK
ncbi:MAG: AsmA-like C-terminal region-containing protein [Bryobacteraceae bacterium]